MAKKRSKAGRQTPIDRVKAGVTISEAAIDALANIVVDSVIRARAEKQNAAVDSKAKMPRQKTTRRNSQ